MKSSNVDLVLNKFAVSKKRMVDSLLSYRRKQKLNFIFIGPQQFFIFITSFHNQEIIKDAVESSLVKDYTGIIVPLMNV